MSILKDLEKIGIIPGRELKIEERNHLAKIIANKLSTNVNELLDSYNELYMRIFNSNMYYAKVDEKFKGVFYFYKNNTIYIDDSKDISNIDEYIIHENIHYLQNFSKITKKNNRAGICQFMEFKIFGLGINEALVQYITAKALGNKVHRINNDIITICTNSENYYKYMTSLVAQILFFVGAQEAVESCISSTDKFENELYNTFEENTNKIIKNFDLILNENNKIDRNEDKIIEIYMQTQELIYTTYFNKNYKRVTTIKEVGDLVKKLEDYENVVGKLLNTASNENNFDKFKDEMESKFLRKYIEINKNQNKHSLVVVYKNAIYNLWNKILNFIQKKGNKENTKNN